MADMKSPTTPSSAEPTFVGVDVFPRRWIVTGADVAIGRAAANDDDGDERWKSDVNDILRDEEDGLVLRDDSLDALEMSGQEMCRLLRFLPDRNDPECLSGAGSGMEAWSLDADAALLLLLLCHIHGHLPDVKLDLKLFLRRMLEANPLTDCWNESWSVPKGAMSLRSIADEPLMMVGTEEGDTEAGDLCRKWRRILGKGAGDDERMCEGGEWGNGVGGTDPDLYATGGRTSSRDSAVDVSLVTSLESMPRLGRRFRRGGLDWLNERQRSRFEAPFGSTESIAFLRVCSFHQKIDSGHNFKKTFHKDDTENRFKSHKLESQGTT